MKEPITYPTKIKHDFCMNVIRDLCGEKPVPYYYFCKYSISIKSKYHIYALAFIFCIRNEYQKYSISCKIISSALLADAVKIRKMHMIACRKFEHSDFDFLNALSEIRDICMNRTPMLSLLDYENRKNTHHNIARIKS